MCNGEHNNKRWTKEEEGEEGKLEGKGLDGIIFLRISKNEKKVTFS